MALPLKVAREEPVSESPAVAVQSHISESTLHLRNQPLRMGPTNLNCEPTLRVILMQNGI